MEDKSSVRSQSLKTGSICNSQSLNEIRMLAWIRGWNVMWLPPGVVKTSATVATSVNCAHAAPENEAIARKQAILVRKDFIFGSLIVLEKAMCQSESARAMPQYATEKPNTHPLTAGEHLE